MTAAPRCRFAPSPTGYLHVGGARTVLFNWLFARHTGGEFLLRIEDTDTERNRPELTDNILEMLRWLGLEWDGEIVHQSDRFDVYTEAASKLVASGHAYACDCSPEDVQARNKASGGKPGYDGFCRDRGLEPGPGKALRFRAPNDGSTTWSDLIRGDVTFENDNIEDFVLVRSNGVPTFLLANAIDDAYMAITHVIRAEEHLNGTPKYLLIGEALGLERPAFAHVPIVVNEQRKKLSKRRDDVSVADYKDKGYLPEALRNYLALLGWGPSDGVEVRPIEEMVALFELADVNSSPAAFDVKKLQHVNAEWIRRLAVDDFLQRAEPFLPPGEAPRRALESIASLVQERVKTLAEVADYVDFLHLDEPVIDEAAWNKALVKDERAPAMLDATIAAYENAEWSAASLHTGLEEAAVAAGFVNAEGGPQLAKAQAPVRVAVTGRTVGPPLFESLTVLGRDATLARLRKARAALS